MKFISAMLGSALLLACSACKRTVTCQGAALNVSAAGFDSTDLINVRVERFTYDGKPDGTEPVASPLNVYRVKSNDPLAGYYAYLFDARVDVNYRIHIGKYTANLTDVYFDGSEEKQPFGWSEVEPCSKTAHYTLNGKTFSFKPVVGNSVSIQIAR